MAANTFPILRGPDAQQSRTQDNVNQVLAPVARALQNTPIMGAPAPAWIRPSPLNAFTQTGFGNAVVSFHRDALGYVHIKGSLDSAAGAAAATQMFLLPLGCRPSEILVFAANGTANTYQAVGVLPNGVVQNQLLVAAGGYVRFCFSFLAEQ